MGKKKNKRFQAIKPTTNPFWTNIAKPQSAFSRANLVDLGNVPITPNNQQFQAPHHQQDSMMDLTDDTSPNIPMINAKHNLKRNILGQQSQKNDPATQPIFDTNEDMQDDVKIGESSNNRAHSSTSKTDWQPIKIANKSNQGVVQGSASDIKLVIQGSKPLTSTVTSSSPVTSSATNEKPKPNILASEIVGTLFTLPVSKSGPNLTIKGVQQTAIRAEDIPKGKPFLGSKQINTRITRDVNPNSKPQQYIAPIQPQPVLPTSPVPQNPAQLYTVPKNPRPSLTFHQNYPKGIPKSFLFNQSPQTPEPYSSLVPNVPDLQQWVRPQKPPASVPNVIEYAYSYNPNTKIGYNDKPLYVNTESESNPVVEKQAYSPSDVYADNLLGTGIECEVGLQSNSTSGQLNAEQETAQIDIPKPKKKYRRGKRKPGKRRSGKIRPRKIKEQVTSDGSESPDLCESGQKRLSAFKRLGPLTQPKKPKLTINLLCNKDQSVREVVNETEENVEAKYVPVHLRPEIMTSTDEIVMKYLVFWPWKKPLPVKKTVTFRNSKSVMILEQEQMVEIYDKNNVFVQVSVKGYPATWNKEVVLDILLDTVNGKSFIPCFIEFTKQECKFLVIRARSALTVFHKIGFTIHKEGHELHIAISQTELTLSNIDFIPKFILKKILVSGHSGERSLDLSQFTTKEDLSHFFYFPLNRLNNQMDLVQLQSSVAWEYLTDLNLSHNRLTSIEGFNLPASTPRLKYLDLSYNYIEKATLLLRCRSLELRTIKLEGNPLCSDYTDPAHYVKVLKMMFPTLLQIDGIPIKLPGDIPTFKKNYCPEAATDLIEKFLEIYFPLMDSIDENREMVRELYHERATMTITTRYKLRYGPIFKSFRSLFHRVRVIDEGSLDSVEGAKAIAKLVAKWPPLKHDPFTFTVDVLLHDDFVTIFKVGGLVRLTAETLAEDEHLLAFTRTFVLHSFDGVEYKIMNEMVYWDEPTDEYAHTAFQMTVKPKRLSLKLESTPDEDLKKNLLEIFMNLSDANKSISEKCLEQKEWNLKSALEYFMKLVKLDDLETLTKEIKV